MGFFEVLNGIGQGINAVNSVVGGISGIMGGSNTIFENFGFQAPFNIENLNNDPFSPTAEQVLQEKSGESSLLNYFNRFIYGFDGYTPDINGYTLIFMQPPDLSGISDTYTIQQVTKLISFLAIDFTPPPQQVLVGDVSGGGSGISYGTDVITAGGSLQITFIDTCTLDMFNLHKTWIDYIRAVTKGTISPTGRYLTSGEIDYATSAYVVRFKPVAPTFTLDDIVYVGKAIGIFPVSLPDKEVIGRRDQNELTVLPMQYQCVDYRQMTSAANDPQAWIWDEFVQVATGDVGSGGGLESIGVGGSGGFGAEVGFLGSTIGAALGIGQAVGNIASVFGNNNITKEVNRVGRQIGVVGGAINQGINTANQIGNAAAGVANIFGAF